MPVRFPHSFATGTVFVVPQRVPSGSPATPELFVSEKDYPCFVQVANERRDVLNSSASQIEALQGGILLDLFTTETHLTNAIKDILRVAGNKMNVLLLAKRAGLEQDPRGGFWRYQSYYTIVTKRLGTDPGTPLVADAIPNYFQPISVKHFPYETVVRVRATAQIKINDLIL